MSLAPGAAARSAAPSRAKLCFPGVCRAPWSAGLGEGYSVAVARSVCSFPSLVRGPPHPCP
eukprot:6434116-Alexandrium_andersonii.AAC.1